MDALWKGSRPVVRSNMRAQRDQVEIPLLDLGNQVEQLETIYE